MTTTMQTQTIDVADANTDLEQMDPVSRINWAYRHFENRLVVTTSFGMYSAVMLHMASKAIPGIHIISIDTGHNDETRDFAQLLIDLLQVDVHRYELPEPTHQLSPKVETLDEYLKRAKIDTLEKALSDHHAAAWMSGILKNETAHRRQFSILMRRDDGLYKFHPLLDWHPRDLYKYCMDHELPINDHYFDPLKGEDQNKECGIHLTGTANESYTASQL